MSTPVGVRDGVFFLGGDLCILEAARSWPLLVIRIVIRLERGDHGKDSFQTWIQLLIIVWIYQYPPEATSYDSESAC